MIPTYQVCYDPEYQSGTHSFKKFPNKTIYAKNENEMKKLFSQLTKLPAEAIISYTFYYQSDKE